MSPTQGPGDGPFGSSCQALVVSRLPPLETAYCRAVLSAQRQARRVGRRDQITSDCRLSAPSPMTSGPAESSVLPTYFVESTCIPINAHPCARSTMYLPKSAECQAHVWVVQWLAGYISSTRARSIPACHILQYFGLEVKCRPLHTSMERYQLDQCIIRRSNCMMHPKSGIAPLHSCLAIDGKSKRCESAAPRYSCVPVPWCFFSPAKMHQVGEGREPRCACIAASLVAKQQPSRSRFMHGIWKELSLLAKAQLVGCTGRLQIRGHKPSRRQPSLL